MSSASRRIENLPLLSLLEPGSSETELSPGLGGDGQPTLGQTELCLMDVRSFPVLRRVDARSRARDVYVPGEGGRVLLTDRRVIFLREKYDLGTFGKRGLHPILRAASRTVASVRRGDTVAAGQFPLAAVFAVTHKTVKPMIGSSSDHYLFALVAASELWEVEVSAGKSMPDLTTKLIDAMAAAHGQQPPSPVRLADESERWEYTKQ